MRRKQREVTDINEIESILERANTVHLSLHSEPYPYVAALSFGCELQDGKITVYFHCAKEGLKKELMEKNARVCVQAESFLGYAETEHGITAHYESIVGYGIAVKIEGESKIYAFKKICEHCGYPEHDLSVCKGIESADVYSVTLETVTGKHNLP